jgi:hypothetical protein
LLIVLQEVPLRTYLRGRLPPERLERVVETVAARHDCDPARVEPLEADNWLSTPLVVDDELFVKVVSEQNALVHGLLTASRNLGALASGTQGFFEHVRTPAAMADRELAATERIRDLGLDAPEPVEAFSVDGLGVAVFEYLPAFDTLGELDPDCVRMLAPELFAAIATMHDAGIAHGDLREENVLVADATLYFIDATTLREARLADARAYDLACGLAALAPLVGARTAVTAARTAYPPADLLAAREFLDFVRVRPDHRFDAAAVKGEIDTDAA